MIIPSHIQIETINGICNAKCTMCPVHLSTRKPSVLSTENLTIILNKLKPYQENIRYVSLLGNGETLLDNDIIKKIKLCKSMGFKGIGFPTNCTKLNEKMSRSLIEAGLDTLICSIDGLHKKTYESIRVGIDFETVVNNVKKFIDIRNSLYKTDNIRTKIIIRFIYQNSNKNEWSEFYNYWMPFLNKEIGDDVIKYNIHNCANILKKYDEYNAVPRMQHKNYVCKEVFERLFILSDGRIMLCCSDTGNFFDMGNIFNENPIEVYNNGTFNHYRRFMKEGKIQELNYCKNCTVPQSQILKL